MGVLQNYANAEAVEEALDKGSESYVKSAINSGTIGYKKRNYLYNGSASRERYGITATVNEDGSIMLNGTSTYDAQFMLFSNLQTGALPTGSQFANNKKWIPNGKYIMSLSDNEGVALQMRLAEVDNDEGTLLSTVTEKNRLVTVEERHKFVWCRVIILPNASFDNVTVYPMIRAVEDTDSAFEPYRASVEERLQALEAIFAELTKTTIQEE